MPDGIHAPVEGVKRAASHPPANVSVAEAKSPQLPLRHHAMLASRQLRERVWVTFAPICDVNVTHTRSLAAAA
jgi:hypothetical protein